jgi:hypothetical protein
MYGMFVKICLVVFAVGGFVVAGLCMDHAKTEREKAAALQRRLKEKNEVDRWFLRQQSLIDQTLRRRR